MSGVSPKIYFENTDAVAGADIFDVRTQTAILADWLVANLSDNKMRTRALNSLRRVESDAIEAIVYDIENGTTPV